MTRRNDKRNNRRNRQRNNTPELPPFAQMLFGAILGKGAEMIADTLMKNAEKKAEETPDIHAEGITNQDINNINIGKATLSKLRIPADGSAVEYPVPDNLQFFFDEEGKLMVRKKIEGDEEPTDGAEGNPITYDDVCKKLFFTNKTYWLGNKNIGSMPMGSDYYNDINNCTSEAQAKRLAAFNKLQNIAKYLNGDWKPDFCYIEKKWAIVKEGENFSSKYNQLTNDASIYFKSESLANKAIEIMGKDSLNDLFSTDW